MKKNKIDPIDLKKILNRKLKDPGLKRFELDLIKKILIRLDHGESLTGIFDMLHKETDTRIRVNREIVYKYIKSFKVKFGLNSLDPLARRLLRMLSN